MVPKVQLGPRVLVGQMMMKMKFLAELVEVAPRRMSWVYLELVGVDALEQLERTVKRMKCKLLKLELSGLLEAKVFLQLTELMGPKAGLVLMELLELMGPKAGLVLMELLELLGPKAGLLLMELRELLGPRAGLVLMELLELLGPRAGLVLMELLELLGPRARVDQALLGLLEWVDALALVAFLEEKALLEQKEEPDLRELAAEKHQALLVARALHRWLVALVLKVVANQAGMVGERKVAMGMVRMVQHQVVLAGRGLEALGLQVAKVQRANWVLLLVAVAVAVLVLQGLLALWKCLVLLAVGLLANYLQVA